MSVLNGDSDIYRWEKGGGPVEINLTWNRVDERNECVYNPEKR
jgi:hypothetical protein